jgi:predicted RNA binding protein YcfA (HicA-like mRNA interferase family)
MLKLFRKTGWVIMNRKGSHAKVGKNGFRETILLHKELARGLERKQDRGQENRDDLSFQDS